jgi:hypothetical protein
MGRNITVGEGFVVNYFETQRILAGPLIMKIPVLYILILVILNRKVKESEPVTF